VEQDYVVQRRWLLNRAVHGWGVVYGFGVTSVAPGGSRAAEAGGGLQIGAGLALDPLGRELLQTSEVTIGFGDVALFDRKGERITATTDGKVEPFPGEPPGKYEKACWVLHAHYAERAVGPVSVTDPCSCQREEWDRTCETVRFSLRRVDCEECCADFDCELQCECGTGPCCEDRPSEDGRRTRGGCQCLCEHLTSLAPDSDFRRLRAIDDPCEHIKADLCHGVPLACVQLRQDECNNWVFGNSIESCGPRRLVKRNDLLFDLIRGCDLTRIKEIGWGEWHRAEEPVPWHKFRTSFGRETPTGSGLNVTEKYWVEFSRPVRAETVRADCFSMTVIVAEDEGGWGIPHRVPIVGVEKSAPKDTRPGLITRATLVVDAGWVSDAIESRKNIFNEHEGLVEIEVRGDFIVDCNGQTVDANAIGLSASPTGNGTPGGTFLSSFRVHEREPHSRAAATDADDHQQGVKS
jgi:hypothetical protein